MSIYFAHVGRKGSVDFGKTLRKPVLLSTIEENLESNQMFLINDLKAIYPNKKAYCWGIPSGGTAAIRELKPGDFVFLVEYLQMDPLNERLIGPIPLVVKVMYYSPSPDIFPGSLHNLSKALWGNVNYPQIFFVIPFEIKSSWETFCGVFGYKKMFNPAGKMMKVNEGKVHNAGGEAAALKKLLGDYYEPALTTFNTVLKTDDDFGYYDIGRDISDISRMSNPLINPIPDLEEDRPLDISFRKRRDAAFGTLVKQNYKYKCAICGTSLASIDGKRYEAEAAHIYPIEHGGSDDIRNGICLCRLHHWAFDEGLYLINDDYSIETKVSDSTISTWDGKKINLPDNHDHYPLQAFLKARRDIIE